MKIIAPMKLKLMILALQGLAVASLPACTYTNLVGDMDQNPPPNPNGIGIIHQTSDPTGFDLRQVGGTVTWIHDLSAVLHDQTITTVTLSVAVVGLIDQNFDSIDNRLFVNGVEIPGAFDDSHDGWQLYVFPLDPAILVNGILVVELVADAQEGWGGPDYSQLVVTTTGCTGEHKPPCDDRHKSPADHPRNPDHQDRDHQEQDHQDHSSKHH